MKWNSNGDLPVAQSLNLELFPLSVRAQAANLISRTGNDAVWVIGPLSHAVSCGRFDPLPYSMLVIQRGDGPNGFSRQGWLDGLVTLSNRYPDISRVLWDTIAIMGLRPMSHVEEEIPNLGPLLRHDWGVSDAALHAAAKATALWSDICHTLGKKSGCYPEHGCGCSHITRGIKQGTAFPPLPSDRAEHVTREFWEHFMAELALIYLMGFPFALQDSERIKQYEGTLVSA